MRSYSYSGIQLFGLVFLRVAIGWYFLYEGLAKILAPNWSAYGYLMDSKGFFAPLFKFIAENPDTLNFVNFFNMYGLTLIGLSLILGFFSRVGHWGAIALLVLYYLSHPPLLNVKYLLPPEGSYLWIDKNFIILCATIVSMLFVTSRIIGFDRIIFKTKRK